MNIIDLVKENLSDSLVSQAAGYLGESAQATSKGIDAAIPSILGGILNVSKNSDVMSEIWKLIHHNEIDSDLSKNLGSLFSGNSPLSEVNGPGPHLNKLLFGLNNNSIIKLFSAHSGFKINESAGKLLNMVAPLILICLRKISQNKNFGVTGLTNWLSENKTDIHHSIPSEISSSFGFDNFLGDESSNSLASSTDTPTEINNEGNNWWLWLIGLLATLGFLWFIMKGCNTSSLGEKVKTTMDNAASAIDSSVLQNMYVGVDSAVRIKWLALGELTKINLPGGTEINIPQYGVENKFISWIVDTTKKIDKTTWFDFDRILFETNMSTLNLASMDQISNIVAILNAYPKVNVKIGGYTDNVGDASANKTLSGERAKSVMAAIVEKGIASERMSAEGYGPDYPIGDNATEAGRNLNRRVALRITKK